MEAARTAVRRKSLACGWSVGTSRSWRSRIRSTSMFSTATFHWIKDHDNLFRRLAAAIKPGGQARRPVRRRGKHLPRHGGRAGKVMDEDRYREYFEGWERRQALRWRRGDGGPSWRPQGSRTYGGLDCTRSRRRSVRWRNWPASWRRSCSAGTSSASAGGGPRTVRNAAVAERGCGQKTVRGDRRKTRRLWTTCASTWWRPIPGESAA